MSNMLTKYRGIIFPRLRWSGLTHFRPVAYAVVSSSCTPRRAEQAGYGVLITKVRYYQLIRIDVQAGLSLQSLFVDRATYEKRENI